MTSTGSAACSSWLTLSGFFSFFLRLVDIIVGHRECLTEILKLCHTLGKHNIHLSFCTLLSSNRYDSLHYHCSTTLPFILLAPIHLPYNDVLLCHFPWHDDRWMNNDNISYEKVCPMCAEKIKLEAKICRYCGHKFTSEDSFSEDTLQ